MICHWEVVDQGMAAGDGLTEIPVGGDDWS